MTGTRGDLIKYRLARAKETYDDALILAERQRWNSSINRLYYSAYYSVMALLLSSGIKPSTHNGAKSMLSEHFIKSGKIEKGFGKVYSQLFTWRQKGDYDDLFDFQRETVMPYFEPVRRLISLVEEMVEE